MAKTNKTRWGTEQKLQQDTATGAGAMSVSFDPEGSCKLLQVNLHLSAASATSENLTITLNSDVGTAYDLNIVTQDMDTIADLLLTSEDLGTFIIFGDDTVDFAWTNTNARTWGLEIIYQRFAP